MVLRLAVHQSLTNSRVGEEIHLMHKYQNKSPCNNATRKAKFDTYQLDLSLGELLLILCPTTKPGHPLSVQWYTAPVVYFCIPQARHQVHHLVALQSVSEF